MLNSPYLDRPLRSHAEASAVIARGPYAPLLADHQPDISYQGDNVRRGRDRAVMWNDFCTRQIVEALGTIAQTRDIRRKARERVWIIECQKRRRGALRDRRLYDEVMGRR